MRKNRAGRKIPTGLASEEADAENEEGARHSQQKSCCPVDLPGSEASDTEGGAVKDFLRRTAAWARCLVKLAI